MMRARVWLALLATALGLYFVGRWQGAQAVAATVAESQAETALAGGAAYRAYITRLSMLEQRHLGDAQRWHTRAESLAVVAAHRDTVRLEAGLPVDTMWRVAYSEQRRAAEGCFVTLRACQVRADAAEHRAAGLDSSLATLLHVSRCKILWVTCPSRTALFVVGGGLGFGFGLWAAHH